MTNKNKLMKPRLLVSFTLHGKRFSFYVSEKSIDENKVASKNIKFLAEIRNNNYSIKKDSEIYKWIKDIEGNKLYMRMVKFGFFEKEFKANVKTKNLFIKITKLQSNKIKLVLENIYTHLNKDEYPFTLNELEYKNFLEVIGLFSNKEKTKEELECEIKGELYANIKEYIELAYNCFDSKKYHESINYFTKVINFNPIGIDEFVSLRGLAYSHLGMYQESIEDFTTSINMNITGDIRIVGEASEEMRIYSLSKSYYRRYEVYTAIGETKKALKDWDSYHEILGHKKINGMYCFSTGRDK